MGARDRLPLIVGALLVLIGLVWALQGAGLLAGSVMSDDRRWFVIGTVTAIIGAALAFRGLNQRR